VSNEDFAVMHDHLKKKGFTMPVYRLAGRVSEKFYSRKIPTSYLISPEGKMVMIKQGAADWGGKHVFEVIDNMLK
jgi:hypothetical protein